MSPLRKLITPTTAKGVERLTILVEVMLVYVIISTGIGAFLIFGLIQNNHRKAENVGIGLSIIACNAGLARENSILDRPADAPVDVHSIADAKSNLAAATGYFKIMPLFNIKYPNNPRDRFGDQCPYPELTRRATLIVKNMKESQ